MDDEVVYGEVLESLQPHVAKISSWSIWQIIPQEYEAWSS
jgi:hypothetical protein